MKTKLKICWFWIVACSNAIRLTLKGHEWHMMFMDLHCGTSEDGRPKRVQLRAMRTVNGLKVSRVESDVGMSQGGGLEE